MIKSWDLRNNCKLSRQFTGFKKCITDISISLDGEFMAAASLEHKAMLFRIKSNKVYGVYEGHPDTINACKFHYNQKSILTGC